MFSEQIGRYRKSRRHRSRRQSNSAETESSTGAIAGSSKLQVKSGEDVGGLIAISASESQAARFDFDNDANQAKKPFRSNCSSAEKPAAASWVRIVSVASCSEVVASVKERIDGTPIIATRFWRRLSHSNRHRWQPPYRSARHWTSRSRASGFVGESYSRVGCASPEEPKQTETVDSQETIIELAG